MSNVPKSIEWKDAANLSSSVDAQLGMLGGGGGKPLGNASCIDIKSHGAMLKFYLKRKVMVRDKEPKAVPGQIW